MNDAEIKLQVKIDSKDGTKEIEKLEKKSNSLDTLLKNKKIDINTDLSKLKLSDLSSRVKILKSELANQKQNSINLTTEQAQQNVKKLEDQVKKTEQEIKSRTEKISSSFTKVGKALTVGLTVPITGLIVAGIKYNATVEDLTTSFEVMTGSAEKAGDIVKRLKDIGSKTPFEFTDLAETTKLLMNYGLTADEAIDKMQMLGDISQGSAEKMSRISMAYGQMSSAGKVNLEDVKQMIEAGFNPLKEISESTGESMLSLYDRISKGTISVDEITASMKRSTSEGGKYFNSMDKQSQTTTGKLSTLKDEFLNATGSLTESLIPAFQSGVNWLTKLSTWFASLSEKQRGMILTVSGVLLVLGPLLMIIGALLPAISAIGAVLGFIASPIGLIVLAIGALIGVFVYLMATSEDFRAMMFDIFTQIWAFLKPIIENIGNLFMGIVDIIKGVVQLIYGIFTGDLKMAVEGFKNIFYGIVNVVVSVMNEVIRVINNAIKVAFLPLNLAIEALNNIPGVNIPKVNFAIPNIPALKVGTDMVYNDGLAYLHKGEQVVNAANVASGGYSGSGKQIIEVNIGDLNIDGKKAGSFLTPHISKTIKNSGGNI